MKKWKKAVLGIAVAVLCFYFLFYAILPVYLAGKPLPVFSIYNKDGSEHEVTVEINDQNQKGVFSKTYSIDPGKVKGLKRGFGWYPRPTLYFITWSEGKYTFRITVDGKDTEAVTVNLQPFKSLEIVIQPGGKLVFRHVVV